VQGEADPYGTVAQVEAIASGVKGPSEVVLLPGVGHAPHLEAPAVLLDHLTKFFLAQQCDLHHSKDHQPPVD
jgi:pimeloyl-ACP methyl ester carboxylesterase